MSRSQRRHFTVPAPVVRRPPEQVVVPSNASVQQVIDIVSRDAPARRPWLEGIAQTQPNELRALHEITTALYDINIVLVRA